MRLEVDGISHSGEGVARHNGKVVFIPYAIPGEVIEAEIIEEKKSYSRGELIDVVEASPSRVTPPCPYYYECGGCSYQHMEYELQLQLKKKSVGESIARIGGIDTQVNQPAGMDNPWNYRNKVIWHLKADADCKKMGYYQQGSKKLVEIQDCPLLKPRINETSRVITGVLSGISTTPNSSIMIQQSSDNGQIMVNFINSSIDKNVLRKLSGRVDSIYETQRGETRLYGRPKLEEKAGNCYFRLRPGSFFQVNAKQNETMLQCVSRYLSLQGNERILDAYCGAGSITLNMAPRAKSVIGVESFDTAVEDAKENATLNGIKNIRFIAGACEKILPDLGKRFDRIIIDPPRAGLKTPVITAITGARPQSIVYVSCNPATLARDLKAFSEQGYETKEVQPIDMFPQTYHTESVAKIARR